MNFCLFCERSDVALDDFRGRPFGDNILAALPENVRAEITPDDPLRCCMSCLATIHRSTSVNVASQSRDDSSLHDSDSNQSYLSSLRSSESVVTAAPSNSMRTLTQTQTDSLGALDSQALLEVNQIKSRPGPKSLKRKWIEDLKQKVTATQQENQTRTIKDSVLQNLRNRARRRRAPSSNSSSRSASSSLYEHAKLSQDSLLSPLSSQAIVRSPSVEPGISSVRKVVSSTPKKPGPSSSKSGKQLPQISEQPKKNVIALSNEQIAPPTQMSPPAQRVPVRQRPTPQASSPPAVSSGDAHSNSAAPRRYTLAFPSTQPNRNRDNRHISTKLQGG